jgi:hypothetical protein
MRSVARIEYELTPEVFEEHPVESSDILVAHAEWRIINQ